MATTRTATKARPADDEPFDFNLDALKPESEHLPFRLHFGGRRWTLTNINELDAWDIAAAAQGGDVEAIIGALRLALGDQWEDFKAIKLPQWKIMPLFRAWQKASGDVDPGESSASSDS
jgi:hypothetical protein